MAKIDTLSMITGGRIERAAITDLQNDLRAQLQGIEIRIDALNSQLGTLSADIKIKEHDCARAYGFGYKAQAKGIRATIETWKEERAVLVQEREQLVKDAREIKLQIEEDIRSAQKAQADAADVELMPAVEKLLKTFTAFCEADDEYRELRKSFARPKNQWPNSLLALNPWKRNFFRQSLESYLKKGKK